MHNNHLYVLLVIQCISNPCHYTIDVEKFAGLNVHGFNPTEVFMEILSDCLGQKSLLVKRGAYIHGKKSAVLLKTTKTVKI